MNSRGRCESFGSTTDKAAEQTSVVPALSDGFTHGRDWNRSYKLLITHSVDVRTRCSFLDNLVTENASQMVWPTGKVSGTAVLDSQDH